MHIYICVYIYVYTQTYLYTHIYTYSVLMSIVCLLYVYCIIIIHKSTINPWDFVGRILRSWKMLVFFVIFKAEEWLSASDKLMINGWIWDNSRYLMDNSRYLMDNWGQWIDWTTKLFSLRWRPVQASTLLHCSLFNTVSHLSKPASADVLSRIRIVVTPLHTGAYGMITDYSMGYNYCKCRVR